MNFSICNHWPDGPFLCLSTLSERLNDLWLCYSLFQRQQPLQRPRTLVPLLTGKLVPEGALRGMSSATRQQTLVHLQPPPSAALWYKLSPWLSVESLDPGPDPLPRSSVPLLLTLNSKTSSPEAGPSTKLTHQCVWLHGLLCQPVIHSLLILGKTHLQQQALSLPLGDKGS